MLWSFARVFIKTSSGRKRFNVLGALNAVTLQMITVVNDSYINAWSVADLLKKLRDAHPGEKITVILDNAKYQSCYVAKSAASMLDIKLLYLPAYSPNLNLIERLWKFLRKEALQKWHPTFEDMQKAVAEVLDNLPRYEDKLKTLMTERFRLTPEGSTITVGVGKSAVEG